MRRIDLYSTIPTNSAAIDWCQDKNLLIRQPICSECHTDMREESHKCEDGVIWRCRKMRLGIRHQKTLSIRHNSIFEESNLSIKETIYLLYEWSVKTSVENAAYELQINKESIINLFSKFRAVVSSSEQARAVELIGGEGCVIEIDECQIGRRKHHRGRVPQEIWIFGAVERNSLQRNCFIEIVLKRNRETLTEVIQRRIHPSSRIISDGWRAYRHLSSLGFNHSVVVHQDNFVDPIDMTIHTQNIENLWRCFRRFLNTKGTYTRPNIQMYIDEFLFRKRSVDVFECMLSILERILLQRSIN